MANTVEPKLLTILIFLSIMLVFLLLDPYYDITYFIHFIGVVLSMLIICLALGMTYELQITKTITTRRSLLLPITALIAGFMAIGAYASSPFGYSDTAYYLTAIISSVLLILSSSMIAIYFGMDAFDRYLKDHILQVNSITSGKSVLGKLSSRESKI